MVTTPFDGETHGPERIRAIEYRDQPKGPNGGPKYRELVNDSERSNPAGPVLPPIERLRADTPGTATVTHVNNAGSALPPRVVVDTVVEHINREATIGGYEAAAEAGPRLEAVYDSFARLLNARADQIAVVENATRAWDMAVYGYPFQPGDRVLTGRAEYVSNVVGLLQLAERHQLELVLIEDDVHGQIDLEQLEIELKVGAAMVAMSHVPTSGGLINPAADVGRLCSEADTFYVLDACQSAGQIPLDVEAIGCDVLSGTGRKYLRGPRGTGFLFTNDRALEILEPPFLDLHAAEWVSDRSYVVRDDARRFENWETNFAGKLGLGAAVDYALDVGVEAGSERIVELGRRLRDGLASIAGVKVHDQGAKMGGIVTFEVTGVEAAAVTGRLSAERINSSVTTSGHARFDLAHRGLPDLVRASVHYYNSEDEVDQVIEAVRAMTVSG